MALPMEEIRRLVGEIGEEPFAFVDYAVTDHVGLFVPLTGQCSYAVTPAHTHPSFSFVISFDDFCQLKVDDRILRSKAGTFRGFSPGVPHQELPADAPSRYVAVMIDGAYFNSQLASYGTETLTLRGEAFASTERLLASLREFMAEFEERRPGWEPLLQATGQRITHLIIREILGASRCENRVDFRMAANLVVEYMHKHLDEKLAITDLARVARLSPSHFSRVFKSETGIAPIEYLHELRLLRAKRMLRDTPRSVTEIALACGFNSSSYLSRCFVSRFQTTPSGFRKSLGMSG